MKQLSLIIAAGFSLLFVPPAHAADWQQAVGPLKTRWAKDVSPANALPEYPRPQMVRKDWLNLNGLWDIKLGESPEVKILVPYPIESALSGVMKHSDRMTYRRSFEIPKGWSGRHVLLHFGAVDWETKVSVNGKQLGVHRGGYAPFSFDITAALKTVGTQDFTVEVFDPTNDAGYPRGKQTLHPGGIMYTPTSGIWQTVWLEPVAEAHIESLKLVPDVDGKCLKLTVNGSGTVEAVASDGGKQIATIRGAAGTELKLAIPNPKLWAPGSPHLYDLRVSLQSNGKPVDAVTSYFGMRKIALGKDDKGVTRPLLNGKFVFQVGPLDQGFWPDGLYTAPTDEALRGDIETMKKLGFNCVRKHIKVEPDRWYYWCDKLGLMVWQDMPSANSYRTAKEVKEKPIEVDKPQFKTELEQLVRNHWNHPAIILWVIFNESQGQHDTEALVARVRELDPSRLINNASGAADKKCGDVFDYHSYVGPGSLRPEENRAAVLGECGGFGYSVDDHRWTNKTIGWEITKDREKLNRNYEKTIAKAWELKDLAGLSALIYTELTDVETECNGFLTYDRAVNKVDPVRAAAVNTGKVPQRTLKEVSPNSQLKGVTWHYSFEKPAADWFTPAFVDSAWKEGPGGFGTKGTPAASVRTEWKTPNIWLRREFDWSDAKATEAFLSIHYVGVAEIYINGVLALKSIGYIEYKETDIKPEAKATLKPGKNLLAVHCRKGFVDQYIDVGIFTESPKITQ